MDTPKKRMSTPTGGNDDQAVRVFLTVIAKLSSAATELADQAEGKRATDKMFGTCQKRIDVAVAGGCHKTPQLNKNQLDHTL